MVKKENASTSLMLAKANMEAAALAGAAISKTDFNTTTGERQPGLVETILIREGARGAANAIRTDRLVKLAGLGDKRTLQSVIEDERGRGALIISQCGHGGGYYLPAGRSEIVAFERTLKRRALGTLRSLRAARRALKVMEGQEVFSDE